MTHNLLRLSIVRLILLKRIKLISVLNYLSFMHKKLYLILLIHSVFSQSLQLNEIVSSNGSTLFDEDNDSPDWIEIYNPMDVELNLSGFCLSDDPDEICKWSFPEYIIASETFLTVFASDKDRKNIVQQWDAIIDWGDDWKYWIGNSQPVSNWNHINTNVSNWQEGASGFGYGDNDDNTYVPSGTSSIFIRKIFNITDPDNISKLLFHIDYDDGYIAYLNGIEFSRRSLGAPNTDVEYNELTNALHEAEIYSGGFPEAIWLDLEQFPLISGNNILAIQVHNYTNNSSDMSCIPFLTLGYKTRIDNGTVRPPNPDMDIPDIYFHTNFKINSNGETVVLTDINETILDSVYTGQLQTDMSIGKYQETGSWLIFGEPTPGSSNNTPSYSGALTKPLFSENSGIYQPGQTISIGITSENPDAEIRITIDGTEPQPFSSLYQYPYTTNQNVVVRARSFLDGWLPSDIESKTYVFDSPKDLPIIFITTDPNSFFDEDSGMYALGLDADPNFPYFGANFWEDWERPIHFEILELDGSGYSANAGAKIFGGWSRGFPQKSLSIFARNQYGPNQFDYSFFPELSFSTYESFVLRNSGNDWESTMMRDGFITTIADSLDVDHQQYRPAVLYLNGDYWGIQNIREKVSEHFIAYNHNLSVNDIDLLDIEGYNQWNIIHGTNSDYINLLDYLETEDINNISVQNAIENWIDIESYFNYQVFQIYIDNRDWPGNNIKFWRDHRPGGKWRWILYDTDFGFSIWDQNAYSHNTLDFALESNGPGWPNPPWSTFIIRKLLENSHFENTFINIYCDLMNSVFKPEYLIPKLDSIKFAISNEISSHQDRWFNNGNWPNSALNWEYKINNMVSFAENRPSYALSHLQQQFDLPNQNQIILDILPQRSGKIKINSLNIIERWTGYYFPNIPIKIKAIPEPGYSFIRWVQYPDSASNMTISNFNNNSSYTALFTQTTIGSDSIIIINEVNYNSSNSFDPEDWVELYNPGQSALDISGWLLKDDNDEHFFSIPNGTEIAALDYLVIAKNINQFDTVFPDIENVIGSFDFGLSGGGDQVRLYNLSNSLIDSLEYDDTDPWPSEPDGNGPSLELINPEMDNSLASSWSASSDFGSPGEANTSFQTVEIDQKSIVPKSNRITNLFPNPFNPKLTIRFELNDNQTAEIYIHNILGKLVFTTGKKDYTPGKHSLDWNVSSNKNIGSGIFFVTLNTLNQSITKKVLYIK